MLRRASLRSHLEQPQRLLRLATLNTLPRAPHSIHRIIRDTRNDEQRRRIEDDKVLDRVVEREEAV